MIICKNCGAQLVSENSKFCSKCGKAVQVDPQDAPGDKNTVSGEPKLIDLARKYGPVALSVYEYAFAEVEKLLRPTEKVLMAFSGSSMIRRNNSMLYFVGVVITNERLLIGGQIKGMFKVSYTAQSFDLKNINAISQSWSIVGADIVIDTLGDDLKITVSSRDIANLIIRDFEEALHKARTEMNNKTQSGAQVSAADELKKFKELLDMGVITQEEFDAKKKQLLGI